MGIICYLEAVDAEQLSDLISCTDEETMWSLLDSISNQDNTNSLNLQKAWHGLHFLLTGNKEGSEPLSWVIFGNHSIVDDEEQLPDYYGFGLRYLLPNEVVKVAEILSFITVENLAANFSPQVMDKALIYPMNIWVRDGNDGLNWLLMFYDDLVKFYQKAASEAKAVLMYTA